MCNLGAASTVGTQRQDPKSRVLGKVGFKLNPEDKSEFRRKGGVWKKEGKRAGRKERN
jgi:hypothetical protein